MARIVGLAVLCGLTWAAFALLAIEVVRVL